jgi:hypothetical protein
MFQKVKKAMLQIHGWEVALECPCCGHEGLPEYRGWEPNLSIRVGSTPTVFALTYCTHCNGDLRKVAGKKLVEMFSGVQIPTQNKKIMATFSTVLVALLALVILGDHFLGVWSLALMGLLGPAIVLFSYRISLLRHRCSCCNPDYTFMGMLGRSCCYRCSACGSLRRLRD